VYLVAIIDWCWRGDGSQFTGGDFIGQLERAGAQFSIDGKGQWRDNVFVERLWRSLEYEEVYLRADDDAPDARGRIGDDFALSNGERPHRALDDSVPSAVSCSSLAELVRRVG
jgi:putative transposase